MSKFDKNFAQYTGKPNVNKPQFSLPSAFELSNMLTPDKNKLKDLSAKQMFESKGPEETSPWGHAKVNLGNAAIAFNLQNLVRNKMLYGENSNPYLELDANITDDLMLKIYANKWKPYGGFSEESLEYGTDENIWEKTTGIQLTKLF